jgi:hypothetical protein
MINKGRRPNKRVQNQQDNDPPRSASNGRCLPLRWFVIIVIATAVGLAVGHLTGLAPGVSLGLAVAGLLHKILD